MKTENMESSESNENIANSIGNRTTISMGALPKRTKTATTPRVNNARAVSPGVAIDPKQALQSKLTPQVAVRV
jgi:hypothetical protein